VGASHEAAGPSLSARSSGSEPVPPTPITGDPDLDRDSGGLELISKVSALLSILEARGATTAIDLAETLGEPLSSIYRLLQSLGATGWVDRGPRRGSYRLGLTLMTIGSLVEEQLDIREASVPALRDLVSTIGVTSFLCVRRNARAVCLERIDGFAVQSLAMQLGSSLPLYAGAAPRVLLAFLPAAERDAVMRDNGEQLNGDPVRPSPAALSSDVGAIRAAGYAISDGDVTSGIGALGAPVFNHRGEVEGAISISGLRDQLLGPAVMTRNIRLLLAAASAASAALGWEPH
jgi:DNA-binding IclR family transcriptional regulator